MDQYNNVRYRAIENLQKEKYLNSGGLRAFEARGHCI